MPVAYRQGPMETVLIVIHLMIVVALVGTVLLQRSEGGALGIGGGGGGGGLMSSRGAANALTRATAILGAAFFATSIALTLLHRQGGEPTSILEGVSGGQVEPAKPGEPSSPLLRRETTPQPQPAPEPTGPRVPQSE